MNHQSDYGYTFGGVEVRTPDLCFRRMRECQRLAEKYPDQAHQYSAWAVDWHREAIQLGGRL